MAIEKIDRELCTGCRECADTCPTDCIRMDDDGETAVVVYPEDCMLCGWCVAVCPTDAVTLTPDKSSPIIVSWG